MGGESGGSSGQPFDYMGGQYASFSGGTPGYNWGALGQGLAQAPGQFASGMEGQSASNITQPSLAYPGSTIPQAPPLSDNSSGDGMEQIMQLIQKILSGGGLS